MGFDISPFIISLKVSFLATMITFVSGVIVAYFVTFMKKRVRIIMDTVFTLPMVLPPTVAGFILLVILGRNGTVGKILYNMGIDVIFTQSAAVIAAAVVSFPMIYRTARSSFERIDEDILHSGRITGMNEFELFTKVAFPIALPGIIGGTVLGFSRAFGEFGATLMIAGNIPGETQTIPMAIFFAAEGNDMNTAYIWVFVMLSMASIVLYIMNSISEKNSHI
ncbi:molybdate ABC transporter permease subunit [Peptacetobacter hominis]|uniref:Molybdenum transport system permease n=1 Tax=Peptacetobacter hominis TaxID=2743610 RepID=A0A544QYG9_9FIRM|nr:molybdate ABC transporter permease subunit [Peptacetobacter hominis]TQQ85756.1 molybdate ABC transporter permease subunit [Peptacetobacter hominis]